MTTINDLFKDIEVRKVNNSQRVIVDRASNAWLKDYQRPSIYLDTVKKIDALRKVGY